MEQKKSAMSIKYVIICFPGIEVCILSSAAACLRFQKGATQTPTFFIVQLCVFLMFSTHMDKSNRLNKTLSSQRGENCPQSSHLTTKRSDN